MSSQTELSKPPKRFYEFGPFRLDPIEHLLLRDGKPVSLTPKAFETLLTLVENSGHVLNRNRLLDEIWPNTFVEESTVAQNIFTLRKALGERPGGEQYIETVPRRGYRFIAPVRELYDEELQRKEEQQPDPGSILEEARTDSLDEARKRAAIPEDAKKITTGKDPVRVVTFFVVFLGLVFGSYLLWKSLKWETQGRSTKTLAVLPFESLNPGDNAALLGLGMSDALITKLSNIKELVVRPTSAVLKYNGLQQEPVAAGQDLKVDLVLVGRVQKVNDRIRVTVQLINVKDGAPIWADKFDEKLIDIFSVQDAISQRVLDALTLEIVQ